MAVVQISRIQQRRGKKQSATGFPQLASGEIGWAIDTQELYIGNGAVSEGAPYVGNTQILTEHVNILDFAEAYTYQKKNPIIQTGPTYLQPIQRTLQERFDERVDIRSFIPTNKLGPVGSIISDFDLTEDIQRAINQLFLGPSRVTPTTRVILHFGPGVYKITNELKIPAYASIEGAGIDRTIFLFEGTDNTKSVIRMVDSDSNINGDDVYVDFPSMKYLNRPRFITISGLTIETTIDNAIIRLDNTDSSVFDSIKLIGIFENGTNPLETTTNKQSGFWIRSTSSVFKTENIIINNCYFEKTGYGIFSNSEHDNITIESCRFYSLFDGISIGGTSAISVSRNDYVLTSNVSTLNNTIIITAHGYVENQLVTYLNGGGANIDGLLNNQSYYVEIINADTIKLRSVAGGTEVNFLTTGNNAQYLRSSISTTGATNNKIRNSYFDLIDRYGLFVKYGTGNSSIGNKYNNVGNNNNGFANATYTIIRYDSPNNQSIGDYFERNSRMKDQTKFGKIPFYPNVKTTGLYEDQTNFTARFETTPTEPLELLRLPVHSSSTYCIDYVLNKNTLGFAIRTGTLHITVNLASLKYHIQDHYSYTGSPTVETIEFSVELKDFDEDLAPETLIIKYWNPTGNGIGTINYTYRTLTE